MPPKRGHHPQAVEEAAAGALQALHDHGVENPKAVSETLRAMMDQSGEWQRMGFSEGVVSSDIPKLAAMSQRAKAVNEQRATPGKRPRGVQDALE